MGPAPWESWASGCPIDGQQLPGRAHPDLNPWQRKMLGQEGGSARKGHSPPPTRALGTPYLRFVWPPKVLGSARPDNHSGLTGTHGPLECAFGPPGSSVFLFLQDPLGCCFPLINLPAPPLQLTEQAQELSPSQPTRGRDRTPHHSDVFSF